MNVIRNKTTWKVCDHADVLNWCDAVVANHMTACIDDYRRADGERKQYGTEIPKLISEYTLFIGEKCYTSISSVYLSMMSGIGNTAVYATKKQNKSIVFMNKTIGFTAVIAPFMLK